MNEIIEFFTDPLRLTLLVAGVVVVLGILIFGRRSNKPETKLYRANSHRDFIINNPPPDTLVDEEVIVLSPRRNESMGSTEEKLSPSLDAQELQATDPRLKPESDATAQIHAMDVMGEDISMKTFEYQQANENEAPTTPAKNEMVDKVEEFVADVTPEITEEAKPQAPSPERFIVFHIVPSSKETFSGKDIHQVASNLGLAYGKHGVYHFPADSAREGDSQFCLVNMTAEGNFEKDSMPTLETRGISFILRLTEETKDGLALFSNMLAITQGMSRRLGGDILDQTRVPLTPDVVTNLRSDIAKFHTQLNKRTPVTEV